MARHNTNSPDWLRPRQCPQQGEINPSLLATLALLIFVPGPATAAIVPGPDAFGYTVAQTTNFTFLQITNGSPRVLWFDEDTRFTANIGFSFNFYESNYSTGSFNPNGLTTFGAPSSAYVNVDLTTTSPSDNLPCMAVLWDDWETEFNGKPEAVYYKTTGVAGSRQFIVQWNKVVPINGDGTNDLTFEIRVLKGSDRILFSFFDTVVADETTSRPDDASLGVGATVGILSTPCFANRGGSRSPIAKAFYQRFVAAQVKSWLIEVGRLMSYAG